MNKKNILTLISLLSSVSLSDAASVEQLTAEIAASSKVTSPATSSTTKSVPNFLSFKGPDELNLSDKQISQPTDEFAQPLTFYERTRTPAPIPDELKPYEENPGQNDKPMFVLPNWEAYEHVEGAIEGSPGISFLVETPSVTSKTQLPNQKIEASSGNLGQKAIHAPY